MSRLFPASPEIEFRTSTSDCSTCAAKLNVQKSALRKVSTLHLGAFKARETFMQCPCCKSVHRCEELAALVPPGGNFGYDIIVFIGQSMFLQHRNEAEIVDELAQKNVCISPREVSLLAQKFIVYLSIAHQQSAATFAGQMQLNGGYICHLDATCEGGDPLLMSSIDSISQIVLSNIKIPSESEAHIVPFLERIKTNFGRPLAMVHDMGKGILKAVDTVFPDVADFICHFHFLRDIGKDYFEAEYDIIRKQLRSHGVNAMLRKQAKGLKTIIDENAETIEGFEKSLERKELPPDRLEIIPAINTFSMIQWVLKGMNDGNGYGFPFDQPHLAVANRIKQLDTALEAIKGVRLRGEWKDNKPYHRLFNALKPVMKDRKLWAAVDAIGKKIATYEKLRSAMRIAMPSSSDGLNDDGAGEPIKTIEKRVKKFRDRLVRRKGYSSNTSDQKMIKQIDKYWRKLFADPIVAQTPDGPVIIHPQRTNNILEQFFRQIKRGHRRRTGNASSSRMLRTILAETPLVRNLENPAYMKILLNGRATLEERVADIDIIAVRKTYRDAKVNPERIPSCLNPIINLPDLPDKIITLIKKGAA
jgi:hypothetical protein